MNDSKRKQMKDVIVPQNDVIRRPVNVPESYPPSLHTDTGDRIEKNPFFEKPRTKKVPPRKVESSDSKGVLWALLFVLLLGSGFVGANYFATATVEIAPITKSATFDNNFTALKDGSGEELTFQFMSLIEEKTKEIPATVEKKIQMKASGRVVIFNAYNSESQRLIKNTRLESPDHKIFRIDQSVVVPGTKTVSGKIIPGSIEVLVYADVAGKEYNIGVTNFTIPGFKDDPRFSKFTAASKADSPLSGGFSGVVKVPTDEAVAKAREELKVELKKEAIEKARTQIPPNVSFFPGSMVIKFEEVPQDLTAEDPTKVSVRATISVFFFDTILFTKKLVEAALPDDKEKLFAVSNLPNLTFNFINSVDSVVLADLSKLQFHIVGTAAFLGQIDANKISDALAGKDKKDFGKIISGESNIYKADLVMRPLWKSVFPSDAKKIKVKIITE